MLGAMRKRKRMLVVVALVAAVTLAGFVGWLAFAPSRHPINLAGFEQIREGMPQAEVEDLLGGPPGNYGSNPPLPFGFGAAPSRRYEICQSNEAMILLFSSADGTVAEKRYLDLSDSDPSLRARVRRWLGR
jgi:hypothetical protein